MSKHLEATTWLMVTLLVANVGLSTVTDHEARGVDSAALALLLLWSVAGKRGVA